MSANEFPLRPDGGDPASPSGERSIPEDGTLLLAGQEPQRAAESQAVSAEGAPPVLPPTESLRPIPPSDHQPIPEIEGFEILQFLGEGSFGRVWKARDLSNGKTVAVKFFTHGAGERLQVLLEEVQQHAQLDGVHGIVDLKKVVTRANPPYYVMGFADRGSLAGRLEAGPIPLADAVRLFTQAAEALAYVHAKGICHCDLKPGNILLDARGQVLLADFGQAQLSMEGSAALGTFFYMPPEQANLADPAPDPRWDVYDLGAVVYAALTGAPPRFDAKMLEELKGMQDLSTRLAHYRSWLGANPAPSEHRRVAGMDAGLANILDRCLHTDPARRPSNAGALLNLLRQRTRRRRQRPMLWLGMTASLLAVGVTTLLGVRSKNVAIDAYQRELTQQQLDSDSTSASIVAQAVQSQLLGRLQRVETTSTAAMANALLQKNLPALEGMLGRLMSTDGRPAMRFAETTVSNDKGELVAMMRLQSRPDAQPRLMLKPIDPQALPARFPQYSWRDWFSGQGDRYEEAHLFHLPITEPHISDPYVSSIDPDELFLSISTPIREKANDPPIGVLEAAVRLEDFNRWLRQARIGRRGFAVLLDRRRYCVLHIDPAFRPKFGKRPERFLSPEEEAQLFTGDVGAVESYRDPVLDRDFMAGYARMTDPRIGWVALVQHNPTEMLTPSARLREQLDWIGMQSFLLVGVVTGGLWGWLFWMLRRSENPGDG